MYQLAHMTWTEVRALLSAHPDLVAILPVGATEAHGPHLPMDTDVIIATAMAEEGARRLAEAGITTLLLPAVAYSPAAFAASFAGTVSMRPETATAVIVDLGYSLARHGVRTLAIANAHLDPAHIGSLREGAAALADTLDVVFPDVTRRPWAPRLTPEFRSGACHAGCYEGSIVLAAAPQHVRLDVARALPPNPASLSTAIREGKASFEAAGGPEAYFGAPAEASAEEGRATLALLGGILRDAVLGARQRPGEPQMSGKGVEVPQVSGKGD